MFRQHIGDSPLDPLWLTLSFSSHFGDEAGGYVTYFQCEEVESRGAKDFDIYEYFQ